MVTTNYLTRNNHNFIGTARLEAHFDRNKLKFCNLFIRKWPRGDRSRAAVIGTISLDENNFAILLISLEMHEGRSKSLQVKNSELNSISTAKNTHISVGVGRALVGALSSIFFLKHFTFSDPHSSVFRKRVTIKLLTPGLQRITGSTRWSHWSYLCFRPNHIPCMQKSIYGYIVSVDSQFTIIVSFAGASSIPEVLSLVRYGGVGGPKNR